MPPAAAGSYLLVNTFMLLVDLVRFASMDLILADFLKGDVCVIVGF